MTCSRRRASWGLYTCPYTSSHTCPCIYAHAYMPMHICPCTYAHAHVCTHVCARVCTHVCAHLCAHMSMHVATVKTPSGCLCTNLHTQLHLSIHISIHLSTHRSIRMSINMSVHDIVPVHTATRTSMHTSLRVPAANDSSSLNSLNAAGQACVAHRKHVCSARHMRATRQAGVVRDGRVSGHGHMLCKRSIRAALQTYANWHHDGRVAAQPL